MAEEERKGLGPPGEGVSRSITLPGPLLKLNQALAHHRSGRLQEAETLYDEILRADPGHTEANHLLGVIASQTGRYGLAIRHISKAIEAEPGRASFHNNLGNALQEQGGLEEAAAAFGRAVEARPEYAEALNNLGTVIQELGGLADSLALHERALALKPGLSEAHNNLGNTLQKLGRVDEAEAAFGRALALKPDDATAAFNLSIALLLKGDLSGGFRRYEARWDTKRLRDEKREFAQPAWNASPLGDKTILLHAEQGIGDTLQFVRYARRVAEYGGRRVLECQKELVKLLAPLPGLDAVIAAEEEPPAFDFHASLLSLPRILGTTLETIPREVPYIPAPEAPPAAAAGALAGGGRPPGGPRLGGQPEPPERPEPLDRPE